MPKQTAGWIKLYRQMIDWCWYKDGNTMRVFIHLLLKANSDNKPIYVAGGIPLKRGQVAITYKELCNELDLSERQVRTAINHLIATQCVTPYRRGKTSIYTVVNYSKYQPERHKSDTQSDTQSDTPSYKDKKLPKGNKKGGAKNTAPADSCPQRTKDGIPIARWEDYE